MNPLLNGGTSARESHSLTEPQVRHLRDQVFGHPSTDRNWDGCRDNWLRPESTQWLRERAAKPVAAELREADSHQPPTTIH